MIGQSVGSILSDFIGRKIDSVQPSIKIVDATNKMGVPVAKPKISEYWLKFKSRQLTPADIVGTRRMNPQDINEFQDIPEIELDKRRPASKRLFYGPGVEFDSLV